VAARAASGLVRSRTIRVGGIVPRIVCVGRPHHLDARVELDLVADDDAAHVQVLVPVQVEGLAIDRAPDAVDRALQAVIVDPAPLGDHAQLDVARDLEGFAVSTGSACSSGTLEPSHVLRAMNLPPHRTQNSIRFSLGAGNTEEQVDALLAKLPTVVGKLRTLVRR